MYYEFFIFIIVVSICSALFYYLHTHHQEAHVGQNPLFVKFQHSFYIAYLPALLGDWLQSPYLYKLYHHYGFAETQIAVLYVFGFASTAVMSTIAPVAAGQFGRKKLCILFTILYSIASLMKLSRMYSVLMIGRLFSAIATALLFHTFEAWYLHEHIETHAFPAEWIPITFKKVSIYNSLLAILAGVLGNISAEWTLVGPVAPFILAIPCFIVSGCVIVYSWQENYSNKMSYFIKPCSSAFQKIITSPNIFLLGIIQATFEGVLYVIVFLWTPQLDHQNASLGMIFSSFMASTLLGIGIYRIMCERWRHPTAHMLGSSIGLALLACTFCVFFSLSTNVRNTHHILLFLVLLVYQVSVGIYFPAMSKLRQCILPPTHISSAIINWFRMPLYLLCCLVLLGWHGRSYRYGNATIFTLCSGLLVIAMTAIVMLTLRIRKDRDLQDYIDEDNDNDEKTIQVSLPVNDIDIIET